MMGFVKKKAMAFASVLLVVLLTISMVPQALFTTANAATINCYVIQLTENGQKIGVNNAATVITEKNTENIYTVPTNNSGQIIIDNFIEQGKTYTVKISKAEGYKDCEAEITVDKNYVPNGEHDATIELTPYTKIKVTGKVLDENGNGLSNIGVAYEISDNETVNSGTTTTNNNGEYYFYGYEGCNYEITATDSSSKYKKGNLSITNLTGSGTYDLANITLELNTFTVELESIGNGDVTFAEGETGTTATYNYGSTAKINIKANDNYVIKSIKDNDKEIGNSEKWKNQESYNYTINGILANHTITVEFAVKTYKISFNIGKTGTVEYKDNTGNSGSIVAGDVEVNKDFNFDEITNDKIANNVTVIATANEDYHIKSFKIDENETIKSESNENKESECKFEPIKADHSVYVEFTIDTYKVSATVDGKNDENGKIEPKDTIVNCSSPAELTITPKEGFNISSVLVNGTDYKEFKDNEGKLLSSLKINNDNKTYTLTVNNVRTDITVKVSFEDISSVGFENITFSPDSPKRTTEWFDTNGYTYNYVFDNNDLSVDLTAEGYNRMIVETNGGTSSANSNGTKIKLSISATTQINEIRLYNENNIKWYLVSFGTTKVDETDCNIKNIRIIIDKKVPVISVKEENISSKSDVTVTCSVDSCGDSGIQKIVYSTNELDKNSILNSTTTANYKDGNYEFNVSGEQDKDYFIYAVDFSNNISEYKSVHILIDTTAPEITGFKIEKCTSLSFGTFANDKVKVTVQANDIENSSVTSGVKSITLLVNGNIYKTQNVDKNNECTFDIPEEAIKDNSNIFDGELSAVATDNVGNVGNVGNDDTLMIETVKPDISITCAEPATDKNAATAKDGDWYSGDIDFNITASDKDSGIYSVIATINDNDNNNKKLINDESFKDKNGKVTSKNYTVNTSSVNSKDDGSYELLVTVTDNAGNSSVSTKTIYIDRDAPTISSFKINKDENAIEQIIRFLTFGTFTNNYVKVTVQANDIENSSVTSGVKSITLLVNGNIYKTQNVDKNNECTFDIPEEAIKDNSNIFDGELSAVATDNVGNETKDAIKPTQVNTEINNDTLMIETVKPDISITCAEPATDKHAATAKDGDWYSGDIDFNITASDKDSGINNVKTEINGQVITEEKQAIKEVVSDKDGKVTSKNYTVNTSSVNSKDDGSYELLVTVTDNAGNSSVSTKTIYIDRDAPTITNFEFKSADGRNGIGNSPVVESKEYGYYFAKDTEVTITAADANPSSGIKSITYYLVDKDKGRLTPVTSNVNSENKITFTVKANFKGQIYALATDNVGHSPEENQFVTPDSAIIESAELHNSMEQHIAFSKPSTNYKDSNGVELYADNVPVTVKVTDTYSGIQSIQWSVVSGEDASSNQSGAVTLNNEMNFENGSSDGWSITSKESNLATTMQKVINVANNSNDIIVKVTMTDRAGNTTTNNIKFSIDKTAPKMSVTYDNNSADSKYTDYYKADRTATVVITERNFNAENVAFKATCDGNDYNPVDLTKAENWTFAEASDLSDNNTYTAKIPFGSDGDYVFDISFKDNANNAANSIATNKFTIDKTKPSVSVTYDNTASENGNYYKAARVATITVTEHNFDADRVTFDVKASDNGDSATAPKNDGWTTNGDEHTTRISYNDDAKYSFNVSLSDKAGNEMNEYPQEEFFVDKTAPTIEISGIADKSANNGVVMPIIAYSDTNFNAGGVDIKLSGASNSVVNYPNKFENVTNGQKCTYDDFEKVQSVDDIYTLSVSVTDYAGNPTTKEIMFSVNRFGSVYTFDESLNEIAGKYITAERDIIFTETNVDSLDNDAIKIKMTQNGTPSDLALNKDYTIVETGGNGKWSQYAYKISKEVFASDGSYTIQVFSKDAAGNVNENIDDTKKAEISFGVDKTEPVVVPVDFEDNAQYPVENKTVSTEIKDNLKLDSVKIFLNDEEIEYESQDDNYTFAIPQSSEKQSVRFAAIDAAGNQKEVEVKDILVSTNLLVRWYNNTPLFIISIAGFAVLCIGIAAFLIFGRKRKKADEL